MRSGLTIARRSFLIGVTAVTTYAVAAPPRKGPRVVSTWKFGREANDATLARLAGGGSVLDAVEAGVRVAEADAANQSVGRGGLPNAAGVVQLDACLMNGPGHQAGSVACLEGLPHPITVARWVMERTPHVMLVGDDARRFGEAQGMRPIDLSTPESRAAWQKWRQERQAPAAGDGNHDTIALLAIDQRGDLAGGCSTSGLAYKTPGRVGDSPILGSGLYVDNVAGAAGATGIGENVMRYCATFMIVEAMRHGIAPEQACVAAIRRIAGHDPAALDELHINFIAIDKHGAVGAAGTSPEFTFAVADSDDSQIKDARIVS